MLRFLKDLSCFAETFNVKQNEPPKKQPNQEQKEEKKENPQSPTEGIADAFIQNILNSYFNK